MHTAKCLCFRRFFAPEDSPVAFIARRQAGSRSYAFSQYRRGSLEMESCDDGGRKEAEPTGIRRDLASRERRTFFADYRHPFGRSLLWITEAILDYRHQEGFSK